MISIEAILPMGIRGTVVNDCFDRAVAFMNRAGPLHDGNHLDASHIDAAKVSLNDNEPSDALAIAVCW